MRPIDGPDPEVRYRAFHCSLWQRDALRDAAAPVVLSGSALRGVDLTVRYRAFHFSALQRDAGMDVPALVVPARARARA